MTPTQIRAIRDRLKMDLREFGRVLGCSASRVCHLESGRKLPTGPLLRLLLSIEAGVSPAKLRV
jgi:DNA-binding transcriptional regulator YiaG